MLRRADKEKHNTQGFGWQNWAGKSQQGSNSTHQPDNPPDEGPLHMAPCQGEPHSCTARRVWFTHWCGWDNVRGQVNQAQQNTHAPSLTGLQHKAEGVPQAAIPAQNAN